MKPSTRHFSTDSECDALREQLRIAERQFQVLINQERESRRAIEAAEANLRAVLAASPQPLVVLDTAGTVLSWNRAAELTLGWTADEIVGKGLPIIPDTDQDAANAIFLRLLDGEVVVDLEIERQRRDGTTIFLSLSAAPLHDSEGKVSSIVEIYADITSRRQTKLMLEHLALHDPLTGLLNRAAISGRFDAERSSNECVAFLLLDLDGFKAVNDADGHAFGDEVLQVVADRLIGAVRRTDTVARLGGDEFVLMLPGASAVQASAVSRKIAHSISRVIEVGDVQTFIGATIGVASFPDDGIDLIDLMHVADTRMYAGKRLRPAGDLAA